MPISGRFVINLAIVLLAIGLLALAGIVGLTNWLGGRAQVYAAEVGEARETRIAAVELRSALQNAESSQRGFLVSGNEIYLAPYDAATSQVTRQRERLADLLSPLGNAKAMLDRLSTVIADKIDEMNRTIALKREFRDPEASALFLTNRGKAMMDEANVFLSSIIRATDERIIRSTAEQQNNALWLRWIAIGSALVIVFVVGIIAVTVSRYAREIAQARDDVRNLNVSLEMRVRERTAELDRARDRAETLLSEVNHRVANSLTLVNSLVRLQAKTLSDPSAKAALAETEARIHAVSMVHRRLYSSGNTDWVALDEYLGGLLEHLEISMRDSGLRSFLRRDLEPVKLQTDASINLGVIVSEWVTNAVKYAYPGGQGEVRVHLKRLPGQRGELSVEDDGVGRSDPDAVKGTGLGSRVVAAMASSIGGDIGYYGRHPGFGARLTFPLAEQAAPT